jgi:hypothetical protein
MRPPINPLNAKDLSFVTKVGLGEMGDKVIIRRLGHTSIFLRGKKATKAGKITKMAPPFFRFPAWPIFDAVGDFF